MRPPLISVLADQPCQMHVSGSECYTHFLLRLAAGADIGRLADLHLQFAAGGAPESPIGFLRPLQQQRLAFRIETV